MLPPENSQPSIFTFKVRSYEGDPWGRVTASTLLKYLEQAAIGAATERGFGSAFHTERGSTWVIRRMTLLIEEPSGLGDTLRITTWLSNLERVRGGREYRLAHEATGEPVASALAEWVYLDRATLRPLPLPPELAATIRVPGAPAGNYSPPELAPLAAHLAFSTGRTVQWYECDSHGHVNNSIYADWLDEAMRDAARELGYGPREQASEGRDLRGIYYALQYRRAALPEERLRISTVITAAEGNQCAADFRIETEGGTECMTARCVYAWLDASGERAEPPEGWEGRLRSGEQWLQRGEG
jgi:acyl-CoA thioester hydrolase